MSNIKLFVCLGIFLIAFAGCKSDNDEQQEFNTKSFFKEMDKLAVANDENYLDLEGNWRFSIGDDSIWASQNFDDINWEKIKVPGSWEDQGFYGYNGYAWYRKTFKLSKTMVGKNLILNAGFIDDVDHTFINGKLVGKSGGFPPQYVTAYEAYREYYVPKEYLKEGENTIAIRVFDSQLEGGILRGPVGLYVIEPGGKMISNIDLDINLSGMWKFEPGDISDGKNPEFDDKEWKEIFVPAYWETQGYKDYNGFAWYRKSFVLPEKYSGQKLVLLLGMIDDIDQTFVNGIFVGSTGDWNFDGVPANFNQNDEWQTLRGYYIPDNLLKPGKENIISVRVYDGFIDGGIYKGPIGLITQDKYREYWKSKRN